MKSRLICILLVMAIALSVLPGAAFAASTMTTSTEGISLIKKYEGYSSTAYWDNTQWSIGYGTESTQGATITEEEAEAALMEELQEVETALNAMIDKYSLSLNQYQFDAIASLSFNCGVKWMNSSGRLLQAILNGSTGNEFLFAISLWANVASVPNVGLLKRRMSEANLYLTGTYDKSMPSNYTYVIFNMNGGTPGHNSEDKMQGYCTDSEVAIMVDYPTKSGCTFDGWYTAASGGTKIETLTSAQAGKTLYAHWITEDGTDDTSEAAIDTGTVKCDTYVNVRAGAGTNYSIVAKATNGAQVSIYEKKTVGTKIWGRIDSGWVCLDYVTLAGDSAKKSTDTTTAATDSNSNVWSNNKTQTGKSGVVTGDGVNVRKAAGVTSARVGSVNKGTKVTVYEQTTVGTTPWGRIGTDQWICMNYVKLNSDSVSSSENSSGTASTADTVTGKVTSNTNLNVRSGAGTNYGRVGSLAKGTSVTIYERKTVNSVEWGRIGTNRWVCMSYITLSGSTSTSDSSTGNSDIWNNDNSSTSSGKTGVVTGSGVNVRKGAGVNNARVTYLNKGAKISVYEQTTVSGVQWGRIGTDRWICMNYVKLDTDSSSTDSKADSSTTGNTTAVKGTGTVTTSLNVRSGAGTNYAKVGSLTSGTKVTVYEIKTVGTTKWGRIGTNRWVSLTYVSQTGSSSSSSSTESSSTAAEPGKGTVTTTLNIRSGAGLTYSKVSTLAKGTIVTITETKNVNGVYWGKIGTNRWICMSYVKMDSDSGADSSIWN